MTGEQTEAESPQCEYPFNYALEIPYLITYLQKKTKGISHRLRSSWDLTLCEM